MGVGRVAGGDQPDTVEQPKLAPNNIGEGKIMKIMGSQNQKGQQATKLGMLLLVAVAAACTGSAAGGHAVGDNSGNQGTVGGAPAARTPQADRLRREVLRFLRDREATEFGNFPVAPDSAEYAAALILLKQLRHLLLATPFMIFPPDAQLVGIPACGLGWILIQKDRCTAGAAHFTGANPLEDNPSDLLRLLYFDVGEEITFQMEVLGRVCTDSALPAGKL